MRLFLFHDGIEEVLIGAADTSDAFAVIEERWGADAADELILAHLDEYRDDVAASVAPSRGILGHGDPNTFTKLKFKDRT
jgi:hypothetical protein